MKRSEINALVRAATACFTNHGWALPPEPRWDVTDFGLGDATKHSLVLVNLAEEPEYCEKLMYSSYGRATPAHCHEQKKEDIICRWGVLQLTFWRGLTLEDTDLLQIHKNGRPCTVRAGEPIVIHAGERVTILPGIVHAFEPASDEVIIGEVSTANDDLHDNFFANPDVGRFPLVEEDEPPTVVLVSDHD